MVHMSVYFNFYYYNYYYYYYHYYYYLFSSQADININYVNTLPKDKVITKMAKGSQGNITKIHMSSILNIEDVSSLIIIIIIIIIILIIVTSIDIAFSAYCHKKCKIAFQSYSQLDKE